MITNQLGTFILSVALLLSLRDIYGHNEDEHDDDDGFRKEFGDESVDKVGEESDHLQMREGSAHLTRPPHTTKKLPSMKFLFWLVSCCFFILRLQTIFCITVVISGLSRPAGYSWRTVIRALA